MPRLLPLAWLFLSHGSSVSFSLTPFLVIVLLCWSRSISHDVFPRIGPEACSHCVLQYMLRCCRLLDFGAGVKIPAAMA